MNRKLYVIICSLLLVVATSLYVLRVPFRSGYVEPVTVTVVGYSTNPLGQVTARVGITNAGPHFIGFEIGSQVLQNSVWLDSTNGTSTAEQLLPPQKGAVVSVTIPAPPAIWRVCATGRKFYMTPRILRWSEALSRSVAWLRWIVDTRLLKRSDVEHFYTPETGT